MPLKLPTWLARLNVPPLTHWKVTPLTLYILVYVILYIYAYNGKERKAQPGLVSMLKVKQVPILVGTGTASAAAIGASALIVRNQNFRELGSQILSDLHHLKKSISRLESQVAFLAEVVLWNWKRLDLSFLWNMARFWEKLAVCANQSGIIRKTLPWSGKTLKKGDTDQIIVISSLFTWSPGPQGWPPYCQH